MAQATGAIPVAPGPPSSPPNCSFSSVCRALVPAFMDIAILSSRSLIPAGKLQGAASAPHPGVRATPEWLRSPPAPWAAVALDGALCCAAAAVTLGPSTAPAAAACGPPPAQWGVKGGLFFTGGFAPQ